MAPRKKNASPDDDIAKARRELERAKAKQRQRDQSNISDLKLKLKTVIKNAKRDVETLESKVIFKKPSGITRAGTRRGGPKNEAIHSDSKWTIQGMDEAKEAFDDEEQAFLKKAIDRAKNISDLKTEHIRYLIVYVFKEDLEKVKSGQMKSYYHDRFQEASSRLEVNDFLSEIRLDLLTNEQNDYLRGLLFGVFNVTTLDEHGDFKHQDMRYVESVILAESILRMVKRVYGLKSHEEAQRFLIEKSREAAND